MKENTKKIIKDILKGVVFASILFIYVDYFRPFTFDNSDYEKGYRDGMCSTLHILAETNGHDFNNIAPAVKLCGDKNNGGVK